MLSDKIEQTLSIDTSTVEIEERGVKLRLTVVDTPGFGDSIKNTGWFVYVLFHHILSFELLNKSTLHALNYVQICTYALALHESLLC